ncbi:MAG: type VI secretion system tube protein Hcp [Aridibacter famidurans]|nr:type VI secretion system tube protein Hcp [Aridibacter famidurans]
MQFDGLHGDLKGRYKGWIELDSAQLKKSLDSSVTSSSSGGGASTSALVGEIHVTKKPDSVSPHLARLTILGSHRDAVIHFLSERYPEEAPFLAIELEGAILSNYAILPAKSAGDPEVESFSLLYTKIVFDTSATSTAKDAKDLEVKMGFDLSK